MMRKISYIIFLIIKIIDNFFKVLFKKNLIIHFKELFEQNLICEKKINGQKIFLFIPNYSTYWRANSFLTREPDTIKWIDTFDENLCFWDIGSCVGQFSIYSSKFKNSDVVSFEPSTSNLRILSRNIYINNLQEKIKIMPFLLNSNDGFNLFGENKFIEGGALNKILQNSSEKNDFENEYNMFGFSINTLVKGNFLRIPNYIKIDVDGAEYNILQGANIVLDSKDLKSILIEIDIESKNFENIFQLMKKFGFQEDKSFEKIMNKNYKKIRNFIFKR
tara:strand:+ start:5036 stop:5863 length:828 start_codon:yes stop_codon:yes gene_type:complete